MQMMIFVSISVMMSMLMLLLKLFSTTGQQLVSARVRYNLWIILLIGLVIPFRPMLGNGLIAVDPTYIVQESIADESVPAQEGAINREIIPDAVSKEDVSGGTVIGARRNVQTVTDSPLIPQIAIVVWLAGALSVLGKHLKDYRQFKRSVNRWATPVKDPELLAQFNEIKAQMNLSDRRIALKICPMISTPMLFGLREPTILLPENRSAGDETELILRHELTHYKHKDLWINLLAIVALSLHWFNPLLYFCYPTLQSDGESCCDEALLEDKDSSYRKFYGEVIISMISVFETQKPIALSTCFYSKKLNIKRRLTHIMSTNKRKKGLSLLAMATALCLTAASGSVVVFANSNANIGAEKAKTIALKDAGLKASEVSFVRAKLDRDDGRTVYDVEFYKGNVEYDYEIDAKTGKILEKDKDIEDFVPNPATKPAESANKNSNSNLSGKTATNKSANTTIGVEKAKAIALKEAGLKASEVSFVRAKLDRDDGWVVYEVEFRKGYIEYDFDIDAYTGAILSYDVDHDD